MKFERIWILSGPNLWSRRPMAEAWLDLETLRGVFARELPGFDARLLGLLPGLARHPGLPDTGQTFAEALAGDADLAFVLQRVALELQTLAGH